MSHPLNELAWEEEFDKEFMKDNGSDVEPSFSDPNGQYGPVKAFIRDLLSLKNAEIKSDIERHVDYIKTADQIIKESNESL